MFFRFRGQAGTSTDDSALVGLTDPTPDAVQMQASGRVQGSVHVNYSPPIWTETETSNPRLHITDWTIYNMTLLKHCKFLSWPSKDVHWPKLDIIHRKKTAGEQAANIPALKTSTALRVIELSSNVVYQTHNGYLMSIPLKKATVVMIVV